MLTAQNMGVEFQTNADAFSPPGCWAATFYGQVSSIQYNTDPLAAGDCATSGSFLCYCGIASTPPPSPPPSPPPPSPPLADCLSLTVQVTVVNNEYFFDGVQMGSYRVGPYTYRFDGIPTSSSMGWMGTDNTAVWANAPGNMNGYDYREIDGVIFAYRYGAATLDVTGPFTPSYFESFHHGNNGVLQAIFYDAACIAPSPPSFPPPAPPSPPPPPCLPGTVAVTVVNYKYYFDGVEAGAYSVGPHVYTFTGIPAAHKMAWMGDGIYSVTWSNAPGNTNPHSVQNINARIRYFRYGDATLDVGGSFSTGGAYFRCYAHGDMNQVDDMIMYNADCTIS